MFGRLAFYDRSIAPRPPITIKSQFTTPIAGDQSRGLRSPDSGGFWAARDV